MLVPLVDSPVFELTVPSKLFDCMGLERPIIALMKGEGAAILESTEANKVVPPGDHDFLVNAFIEMREGWKRFNDLAVKNKEKVKADFTRISATRVLCQALEESIHIHKG